MKPVVLISDALFFLLIACSLIGLWYASRKEHLRRAWHSVLADRVAMGALAVLLLFLGIALLDSLHFRRALEPAAGSTNSEVHYAVELDSVLDVLLHDVKEHKEKTYSAPFAHTLFERQTVERPDGTRGREFPRLKYGAAHLKNPETDKTADLVQQALRGVAVAGAVWLALAAFISAGVARSQRKPFLAAVSATLRGCTPLAWDGLLWAAGLLLLVLVPLLLMADSYHVFGTDRTGNDVFFYALKAMRTALFIGTLTSLVTLPLGIAFGIAAGYFGGWVDDAIQYVYTVISSIPYVLLIAASVLLMQAFIETHGAWFDTPAARADARLVALCAIIGLISWTSLARLMRAETLKLREADFVTAAHAFGVKPLRIMSRHILPNAFHIVLITLVLDFSGLVLAEAVLAYVGIGVDPNTISYGIMINGARAELARDPMVWWQIAAAFIFMLSLVLAANLFADAVRDAFDPRGRTALRRRRRVVA
ncbi:ABC transporter permease [Uliginosibacterium sp. H3]|uniref:ABC transporter permease n=1 Tax=Uliginosibacterium silvisoli TaxID=3114758 RepID=A0ABU6K7R9_9RHOO|nr:ABC transporter permease [Uliginosibacterium sp. H3]